MFLAKVNSLLEPSSSKMIYGFDNFSGLPKPVKEDGDFAVSQKGKYCGDELNLRAAIDLFGMKSRIKLFVGDALETIPKFHKNNPESNISFAYLDFDLYEPTKTALNTLMIQLVLEE